MIDEFLTTFRSAVAEPDRETAERIYALATRRRRQRNPQRRLVLAVAVAALVLVPTGVAFGGKLADLFEGTPAPPDVSTTFETFNQMADLSVQQGFANRWPQVDVSKAHGAIEVQTPDGPEDMWAAPNDQGGQCYLIDFANDPVGHNGARESDGGCERQAPTPGDIDFGDFWTFKHPDLKTVYGSVHADAATVRVDFDDGTAATLPVVEHLFLTSTPKDMKADSVTAFDAAGNQVAEFRTTRG
jgi:hypothetical protein